MNISRDFSPKEWLKLQFRTEFTNLPNTSHFGGVDSTVGDSQFMQVTSASGERNIKFAIHARF